MRTALAIRYSACLFHSDDFGEIVDDKELTIEDSVLFLVYLVLVDPRSNVCSSFGDTNSYLMS